MAEIVNRKRDFYSQKQSVREESFAPAYLESAGDVLLKKLSKKQLETRTTLDEQLNIAQNFVKGSELSPDLVKGVSTLEDLKRRIEEEESGEETKEEIEKNQDLRQVLKESGLSRHELEVTLCEKPNSDISKLYAFAVGNKKQCARTESVEKTLPNHPINHIAEIDEEYFGHLKSGGKRIKDDCDSTIDKDQECEGRNFRIPKRRKRPRKRKKKCNEESFRKSIPSVSEVPTPNAETIETTQNEEKGATRPSLWDVKDMKKWCEKKKEYGCKPRTFFTIRDGKIIKLEDLSREDVT